MNTNVDNLNFKVILDDDQFNQKIKSLESTAKKFNTSMSNLLNIERMSEQWSQKDVVNNRKALQAKVDEAKAQEKINREKIKTDGLQRKINAQIDVATQGYKTQSRILQEVKSLALGYLSVHGATQLLNSLIRITGEFEKEKTTLGAMLGDLNQAENIITRIKGLAIESPFTFKELTGYAKQLSAFSVPAEELYNTTKMLADVSAGLGVGMDRLVLAYGQVRSAAFLRGQEVRQFTEAGIPILSELAKQFEAIEGKAVSAGEVFDKISARLVPFEMVAKVFKDMTSEGGKFYNMQEIQAETLKGKYENLKDAIEQTVNAIGETQSDKLKSMFDWARDIVQNYQDIGRELVALIATYGAYKAALVGIELLTGNFINANQKLIKSLRSISTWMLRNPYTIIAAGIAAAGFATYKWATSLSDVEKIQKSVNKSESDFTSELAREESMLNSLYAKLELTKEGTLEYDKAKAKIMQRYSPYIEQLKQEGVEVNNLADIYGNLAEKIRGSLESRYYESSMQDLESVYKEVEKETQKRLADSLKSNRKEYALSEKDKMALNMYVLGGIDEEKALENMSDAAKKYFGDFKVFLDNQRKNMTEAYELYIRLQDDLSAAYQSFQQTTEGKPVDLSLFAKTVQNTLKQFGATEKQKGKFASLWVDNTQDYYEYLDKIRNEYKEIQRKIEDVGSTQKQNLPGLEKQKQAIEAIAKALEISLDPEKDKKTAKDEEAERIKKLNKEYRDAANAAKQYYESIRKWRTEDFNLEGKGVVLDISKVASDLNEKFNEIDLRAKKAKEIFLQIGISDTTKPSEEALAKIKAEFEKEFGPGSWDGFYEELVTKGDKALEVLVSKQREYEKKLAQERIDDLASRYVSESLQHLDLTNWSDKTVSQIEDIRQNLLTLIKEDITLPQSTQLALNQLGLSTDDLIAKVKELFGAKFDDATIEKFKALKKIISDITGAANSLAEEIDALGDTMGDNSLKDFARSLKTISTIANTITDILSECDGLLKTFAKSGEEAKEEIKDLVNETESLADSEQGTAEGMQKIAKSSDWVTMVIKLAITLFSKVVEGINDSQKALHEAKMAAIEYANAINEIDYRDLILSYDSAFGTDKYGKMVAAMGKMKEYQDAIVENQSKIGTTQGEIGDFAESNAGKWGQFSKATKEAWDRIKDLGQGDIMADMRTWWQRYWGTGGDNILTFRVEDYMDPSGMINGEKLKALYDNYGKYMSDANAGAISEIIKQYDLWKAAVEDISSYLSDVFGDAASSMADSFIDAFKESGQAALEYESIMSDIATNIAKSIIESMLLTNIFTDEMGKKAAEKLASGDTVGAMAMVEKAMEAAKELTPNIQALLESLQPYFQAEEEEGATLGSGIKGITEDTANLLASYLNAIRADVSYSKTIWERMDKTTQQIASLLTSVPNLMEYQAQIAANTFDTAVATQEILSELRGVITSDGGYTGVRTIG